MSEYLSEKLLLRDYLDRKGISYNAPRKTYRCIFHDDEHESGTLYENADGHIFHCNTCGVNKNIFGVCAQLEGIPDTQENFGKLLESVHNTLGMPEPERMESSPVKKTRKEKKPLPFPTDEKKRAEINNKIKTIAEEKGWGEIKGSWKYKDKDGNIIALDVRYEKPGERKVITTWWNDGTLKWYDCPVFVYGLERIEPGKKILIHEGCKCADIGQNNLTEFANLSWSGGSGKAHLADWNVIKDYDVYILPDYDDPGLKAARKIKTKLPQAKIIDVERIAYEKQKGDDIEQFLQHEPQLSSYILNTENHLNVSEVDAENVPPDRPLSDPTNSAPTSEPFKILGIGDDSRAYFLTEAGRLYNWQLESLSKNKLMVLASTSYWTTEYPMKKGADWDTAIDDIIRICQEKDFDINQIRGRGAWKDEDSISYFDGKNLSGEYDIKKMYIRLPRQDIGINKIQIEKVFMSNLKEVIFRLNFETKTDAVRCMSWSVLAPFAGALPFRPAILLTGKSGSGKSTIARMIIKKIGMCLWLNGSDSTSAFVRQKVGIDSRSVILDETEAKTEKQKQNRNELFLLMRSSVSDDSPDTGKGGKDGIPISYKMRNMFCFAAIDPTIEDVADENRIFRINILAKSNGEDWQQSEKELKKILTESNCDSIRALTWNK
jgi:hypothetical protein